MSNGAFRERTTLLSGLSKRELADNIDLFRCNKDVSVFATQIFQDARDNSWVCFVHYREPVPKTPVCGVCKGEGRYSNGDVCSACNGNGEVTEAW